MPAVRMTHASSSLSIPVCRERVVNVQGRKGHGICVFANQTKLLLPCSLVAYVGIGDDIEFPIPTPDALGTEILITKNSSLGRNLCFYQAPIGYVSQPKLDKRDRYFVSAEVHHGGLGITTIFLPCEVLRSTSIVYPARTTTSIIRPCTTSCVFRPALLPPSCA